MKKGFSNMAALVALFAVVGGGAVTYSVIQRVSKQPTDAPAATATPAPAAATPEAVPVKAEPTPTAIAAPVTDVSTEINTLDTAIAGIDTSVFSADGLSDASLGL